MKATNNEILTEYLRDKNPSDYYAENAPIEIVFNIHGINRVFKYVSCLSGQRRGTMFEAVYQSVDVNKYGNYPIFSIVVDRKRKNGTVNYEFYVGWDGTRMWL